MNSIQLYKIADNILEATHIEPGEEFDPTVLEELAPQFDDKVESCIAVAKNLKATETALDDEIKRLQAEKKSVANNRERLLDYVKHQMERVGKSKVESGIHKARIQQSPPSVVIIDESKIHDDYKETKTVTTVIKKALIKMFKDTGEISPGTDIKQSTHLRIS